MKFNAHCETGVGWDSFGRFIETITCKGTSHDICITYQTITEKESMDQEPDDDENLLNLRKKHVLQEKLQRLFMRLS